MQPTDVDYDENVSAGQDRRPADHTRDASISSVDGKRMEHGFFIFDNVLLPERCGSIEYACDYVIERPGGGGGVGERRKDALCSKPLRRRSWGLLPCGLPGLSD